MDKKYLVLFLIVFSLMFVPLISADLTTGLQLYYKFDETDGVNVNDSHINNFDGTLTGSFPNNWTPGKIDNGLEFQDSNTYVDMPKDEFMDYNDPISISVWIYPTFNIGIQEAQIVNLNQTDSGTNKQFVLYFNDVSDLNIGFRNAGNTVAKYPMFTYYNSVIKNNWTHIVAIYNGSDNTQIDNFYLYINGELYNDSKTMGSLGGTGNGNMLGILYTFADHEYIGVMDELGIWNRSLSSSEVSELYNSNSGFTYPFSYSLNVTINYPVNNEVYYENITVINFTIEGNETSVDSCWFTLNSGITNTTINCSENITGLGSVEGSNTWKIYINNTNGDTYEDTVTFNYILQPTLKELFTDLNLYYDFNSSRELVSGVYNLTYSRGTIDYNVTGSLIGKSLYFGGDAQVLIPSNGDISMSGGNKSYSIWVNFTLIEGEEDIVLDNHLGYANFSMWLGMRSNGNLQIGNGITTVIYNGGESNGTNEWNHIVVSYNDTGSSIYINGILVGTNNSIPDYNTSFNISLGDYDGSSNNPMTGRIDEFSIFNKSLTYGSVLKLYNGGLGVTYIEPEFINVTITYPLETNYTINVTELNYIYTYINFNASNCWYSLDGGVSNTTITCGDNVTGLTSQEGNNTWMVYINNSEGDIGYSSVTFNKDTTYPIVNLISPTNNSHQDSVNNFTANFSDDTGLKNSTLFIWFTNGTIVNTTYYNFSGSPTNYELGIEVNLTTDGTYVWGYSVSDYSGYETFSENWTITIDSILPEIVWYNPIVGENPYTSTVLFPINISLSDTYLDRVNLTVWDKTGTQTYNNYTENLTSNIFWVNDIITLSEGENIIEVCGSDSLTNSPPISIKDRKTFKKKSEEETIFEMKDKKNNEKYNISRKVTIKDNKGKKINPNSLRLKTKDEWVDNNKHYKTTWEFDSLKVDSFEILMSDEGRGLELLTDRGVTRIVDKDRTYYWRYDDMERAGFKVTYKKQGHDIIIIVKKRTGQIGHETKWVLDPIVGGLNNECQNESVYLDTQVDYAQSGGYNNSGTTPINNTIINTSTTNFTLNASDIAGIKNVTLVILDENDTILNQTTVNYTGTSNTNIFMGIINYLFYEGIYKWYYIVYDTLSHVIQTTISTITFTKTLPTVNINYPTNTVYDWTVTGIQYSTNSNNTCWYSTDGGITNSTNISAGTNWTTEPISIPYGSNTWTVWCLSFEDALNSDSVTFTTNISFIYTNIYDPTNQSYFKEFTYNNTRINIPFNVTFNSSYALEKCWYLIDNSEIEKDYSTNDSFEINNNGWQLNNGTLNTVHRMNSTDCMSGDICLNFSYDFFNSGNSEINKTVNFDDVEEICYESYTLGTNIYSAIEINGTVRNYSRSDGPLTVCTGNLSGIFSGYQSVKIGIVKPGFNDGYGTMLIDNITYYQRPIKETNCTNFNTTISVPYGSTKVTQFGRNTELLLNYSSISFNYNYTLSVNNHTYNNPVYETSNQLFTSNVTYDSNSWNAIFGYLVYNNTPYLATKTEDGNNVRFERNVTIPIFPSSNFSTFYWSYVLNNITGTFTYNDTIYTQDITRINLTLCQGEGLPTLNFTLKNENSFNIMKGSLEATFLYGGTQYSSVVREYSYKYIDNNLSSFVFCISPNESSFYVNSTVSYYTEDFDRREYFMVNSIINNITQNISLYLLSTNTTDLFTLTVLDENDRPVESAYVRVQRWDIGTDNFYTVGMIITDNNGKAIINLRLTDEWYRYQVIYNDTLYLTTEPYKEGTTERTLNIRLSIDNVYKEFKNIDYSLTFNNQTNITTFTYADTTGASAKGCLKITKITPTKNTLISYQCVESTSGVISTYINDTGLFSIQPIIILTSTYGGVEKVLDNLMKTIGNPERFTKLTTYGQFISLMLVGTAAFIGVSTGSLPLGLLLITITLIGVNLLGWLKIYGSVLYSVISIIILIAFTLRRKRG